MRLGMGLRHPYLGFYISMGNAIINHLHASENNLEKLLIHENTIDAFTQWSFDNENTEILNLDFTSEFNIDTIPNMLIIEISFDAVVSNAYNMSDNEIIYLRIVENPVTTSTGRFSELKLNEAYPSGSFAMSEIALLSYVSISPNLTNSSYRYSFGRNSSFSPKYKIYVNFNGDNDSRCDYSNIHASLYGIKI